MKIRLSFVSNSSSSSFILVGNNFSLNDKKTRDATIKKLLEDGQEIWLLGDQHGWSGDCADDIFRLTTEMFEVISSNKLHDRFAWFLAKECKAENITKDDLPDGRFSIMYFDKDYRTCESPNDIMQRYVE